jgi:hypothetical protein
VSEAQRWIQVSEAAPISLDDRLREVEANLIGWAERRPAANKAPVQ